MARIAGVDLPREKTRRNRPGLMFMALATPALFVF